MSIHQWPVEQQPREKLLTSGAQSLSDAELLAIFLRTGIKGCSAVDLARQLLQHFGSLTALFNASLDEFCQTKGMGTVKYVQFQAVLEMARRYYWEELLEKPMMNSAEEAGQFLLSQMAHLHREVFSCLFLDNQHKLISYEELFFGTINQSPVFPREIAKRAMQVNAAAVILAHNHPSGIAEPSIADKEITKCIRQALNVLDVRVLDHLVVGRKAVYSFAGNGLL